MATVTEDLKKDAGDVQSQLVSHISALSKQHASISFAVIGVLVLVLALCAVGGYFGLRSYENQIARAEAQEKQYDADRKDLATQLAANTAQRADATKQQQLNIKVTTARDTATDAAIAKVNAPGKTAVDALQDLSAAYKGAIKVDPAAVTADGQLVFPIFTVQNFTSTKLDRDRLADDLASSAANLKLEQSKTVSLTADLTKASTTLDAANKTIADYKKVAKRSRWKKIGAGALKVGIFVAGVELGHKL